jgi:catalase (peroxidase I)
MFPLFNIQKFVLLVAFLNLSRASPIKNKCLPKVPVETSAHTPTPESPAPSSTTTHPSPTPPSRLPAEADYQNLYDAIENHIESTTEVDLKPKFVRAAFHDLMNFDGTSFGAEGCMFDDTVRGFESNSQLNAVMTTLADTINANALFSEIDIPLGDLVSLAGKVSIEMAFPCVRPDWSGGRKLCSPSPLDDGPPANMNSKAALAPFLTRYGMNDKEMAVLTIGSHAMRNARFMPWSFHGQNSGPQFIQDTVNLPWKISAEAPEHEISKLHQF